MNKFSQRSYNSLKGIHPDLVTVLVVAIQNSPFDFTITNGVRTAAEQQALYAQGRTKKGIIVTNADGVKNKSNHQAKDDGFGYAVDLYPYFNGSVQTAGTEVDKRLASIASHIKQTAKNLNINIEWGGDWKSIKDTPHFELKR
jgi:peptidoglycan L-alanyl-D-glutamate endopeptidase CwlK